MFFFKDNAELDTLDNVPAEYHLFYVKGQDNKFTLKTDLKSITENIDGLRTNLNTATGNVSRANQESADRRRELEAFTTLGYGANAGEVKAKFDQMQKDLTDGKKINPDTIRQEITTQLRGEIDTATNNAKEMETELTRVLVDDTVTRSILENRGNLDLLAPIIRGKVGVVKDPATGRRIAVGVNEKGEALPGVDGGYMPVSKVVEAVKKDTKFAAAFEAPKQSGGGPVGGGGALPRVVGSPAGGGGQGQGDKAPTNPTNKIAAGLAARAAGGVAR